MCISTSRSRMDSETVGCVLIIGYWTPPGSMSTMMDLGLTMRNYAVVMRELKVCVAVGGEVGSGELPRPVELCHKLILI